jgi:signal transduction histidine kinase
LWIRRHPLAAFLINGLAVYALIGIGYPSDFYQWTNVIALFAVSARVKSAPAVLTLILGWAGVVSYFIRFPYEGNWILAGAVMAIWTAAWFAGRAQYARVRELDLTRERDRTRADLVAQQARSALESQRGRIARDLHDIIGHAVNVMVVHAGAGQVKAPPDSETRAAFDVIARTGRTALADLDRLLDLLQGVPERSPLPGIAQLGDLCRGANSARLTVELTLEGADEQVPPSLGLTTYRIVQEALTNVIKHSGASTAVVAVSIGELLVVSVRDNGGVNSGGIIPGRGLQGIVERAGLHGGTVTYGPHSDGGFEVRSEFTIAEARLDTKEES